MSPSAPAHAVPADALAAAIGQVLNETLPDLASADRIAEWVARRGLGLVPIADPHEFTWPGTWIALTSAGRAVVMYGDPSAPLDGTLADGERITGGIVIAAHDLDLEQRIERRHGSLVTIVVAPSAAGPTTERSECRAIAGHGLEGDRYALGVGRFSQEGRTGQHLTLIDADDLEAAGVTATEARRNLVTRGIDLDGLVGTRFCIGEIECVGERRAEPCAHLQRITRPGILRALVHRGGIRADITTGGTLRVGDRIEPRDDARHTSG